MTSAAGNASDQAAVNLVGHLDGTPKDSTRRIDTGSAIAATSIARPS